jgi:hypothetical protein
MQAAAELDLGRQRGDIMSRESLLAIGDGALMRDEEPHARATGVRISSDGWQDG